jgi:hypothetical protein
VVTGLIEMSQNVAPLHRIFFIYFYKVVVQSAPECGAVVAAVLGRHVKEVDVHAVGLCVCECACCVHDSTHTHRVAHTRTHTFTHTHKHVHTERERERERARARASERARERERERPARRTRAGVW